ncbi:MAG: DUF302 domain-containing protein [Deltaproteobacteria bacterium]|nr:DUF302 domain-containing protein [Deltaproteobacteria bacterium]
MMRLLRQVRFPKGGFMSRYALTRKLDCGYDEAVEKAKAALEREGFGILSEIRADDIFRKNLNKNFRRYLILGACDPGSAYKALTIESDVGLMLPCNVIIYENDEDGSTVAAADPTIAMSMIENPAVALVAKEVKEKMEKVIGGLR